MPFFTALPRKSGVDVVASAQGFTREAYSRGVIANGLAPTAGTAYVVGIPVYGGEPVNKVIFDVVQNGVGTVPTSITCALLDKTGKVLATSAETKNDSRWTTAAPADIAITTDGSTIYTATATDMYYLAVLQVGSWGTTQMTLARQNGTSGSMAALSGFVVPFGTAGSGLSNFAAVGSTMSVVVTNAVGYWAAFK